MKLYFVKVAMFGIAAGHVERFSDHKAGQLVVAGQIEPFDPKNAKHAAGLAAQEKEAKERRQAAEAELQLERKDPGRWRETIVARRRSHERAAAERMGKFRRQLAEQAAAAGR